MPSVAASHVIAVFPIVSVKRLLSATRLRSWWEVAVNSPNVRRTSRNLRKMGESVKQYWNSVSMGISSTSSMTGISKCVCPEHVLSPARPAIHKPTSLEWPLSTSIPKTLNSQHTAALSQGGSVTNVSSAQLRLQGHDQQCVQIQLRYKGKGLELPYTAVIFPAVRLIPKYTAWWQRHTNANILPRVKARREATKQNEMPLGRDIFMLPSQRRITWGRLNKIMNKNQQNSQNPHKLL